MEVHQLGNSGLLVSELCLGTMIFGEESERSTPAATAKEMSARLLDAGGNFIDTANVYADGRSDQKCSSLLNLLPENRSGLNISWNSWSTLVKRRQWNSTMS